MYIYTVFDRIFGDFLAKITIYIHQICMVLANPNFVESVQGVFVV